MINNISNDNNLEKNINNLYLLLNNSNFFRDLNSKLLNKCKNRRNQIRNKKLSFNNRAVEYIFLINFIKNIF